MLKMSTIKLRFPGHSMNVRTYRTIILFLSDFGLPFHPLALLNVSNRDWAEMKAFYAYQVIAKCSHSLFFTFVWTTRGQGIVRVVVDNNDATFFWHSHFWKIVKFLQGVSQGVDIYIFQQFSTSHETPSWWDCSICIWNGLNRNPSRRIARF